MEPISEIHEVLVAPRQAFVPLADTRVIDRPGWMQLLTPSLPDGGMNEVCLAVLADDEADAVIDATIAAYRERGIRFRWTVGPDSAPADLEQRLRARGMGAESVIGLACAGERLISGDAPGVSVEAVTADAGNVEAYSEVMAQGWGMSVAPVLAFNRHILAQAPAASLMSLARVEGEAVGVGALALLPRSAYLIGAVVSPAFRGRGVYRTLVAARARQAVARGRSLLTCQARAGTSAPILLGLGFHEVCRMSSLAFARGESEE
jgi:GNAT superfamily N-acetyltransferase